jgi:hypothetical protein
MADRDTIKRILQVYKTAWETQDPELILTIFTKDAVYHERILDEPLRGHEAIARYWTKKVVAQQRNISFDLLSIYLDGSTAVAEWNATFDDLQFGVRKLIREVAILEIEANKISSLREYWASKNIGELPKNE